MENERTTRGRLAALKRKQAELLIEQAKVALDEADLLEHGGSIAPRRRKSKAIALPELPPISDIDRARAKAALREADIRRRMQ